RYKETPRQVIEGINASQKYYSNFLPCGTYKKSEFITLFISNNPQAFSKIIFLFLASIKSGSFSSNKR
ncbi:hypothetical protein, partial [Malaciobacter mytili]|uniref:hypothetical protein n=1 Tax=Malaciobacter mytili TaxID=603050 RepID=UPI001D19245F